MRILVFNWRDITHPWAGGAELYVHEIAKRWVKKGNKVTLFCGGYGGCREHDEIDGIEIIRKGGKFTVYLHAFVDYLTKLRKNHDVVLDVINGMPWFTPLYVRKPKAAIIFHLTKNIFFKELSLPLALVGYGMESTVPFIYRNIEFITDSDSAKKEMVDEGLQKNKINIANPGLNHELLTPKKNSKTSYPHVVYLGRLRNYKNIDKLVSAMKTVVEEIPTAKLSIAGTGDAEEELKTLTKELGLQKHVKFYGFTGEKEKVRLLRSAWVFVTPSIKEGWGITVLEANACGTPVIAYNVPGLINTVRNNETGILLPFGTDLSETIIKILKNKKLRTKLSINAIKWSKKFNWDDCADKSLKVLKREIINQGRVHERKK